MVFLAVRAFFSSLLDTCFALPLFCWQEVGTGASFLRDVLYVFTADDSANTNEGASRNADEQSGEPKGEPSVEPGDFGRSGSVTNIPKGEAVHDYRHARRNCP
jgi:hypothetical protein